MVQAPALRESHVIRCTDIHREGIERCPVRVSGHVAFSRSRLEAGPAAPLTLHFLVALFDKTFAFAILAFHFRFA
jgi:hypothetical protein